jgi:hypothetical protein
MVQAARSGKQNITEGSNVSGTSKEMEMKLLGVARASFEELPGDYCDFLRVGSSDLGKGESPCPICQATGNQGRSELRGLSGIW